MTRLDRALNLLERYDDLVVAALGAYHNGEFGWTILTSLRQEKELLIKELTEHGCRRKN